MLRANLAGTMLTISIIDWQQAQLRSGKLAIPGTEVASGEKGKEKGKAPGIDVLGLDGEY